MSKNPEIINKTNKRNLFVSIIKIISILYLIIGIVLWAVCFIDTNWSEMRLVSCSTCDDSGWYSQLWIYYELYTFPFMLLTFPITMLTFDIDNVMISNIFKLYLLFIPLISVWLVNRVIRKRRSRNVVS